MSKGQDKVKYLMKNTLLFTISSFGSKIITFILVPLYTNVLSTEEYGNADLITTSVSLLLFVFSINISSAVLRYSMEMSKHSGGILKFGLQIFCSGFVLLTILSILLSSGYYLNWNYENYIYLLLLYFTYGLNEILSNYLRARDKIKTIVVASLLSTLLTVGCNLFFLLFLEWGFDGYMLSMIFANAVSCIIYIRVWMHSKEPIEKISSEIKKEMIRYSIPLIFNGIAWWINQSLARYFIVGILGVEHNGIFAAASKIPTILSTIFAIFMRAWDLSVIKEYKKEGSDEFYSLMYKSINVFLICSASFLIILNKPLAKVLFAKDFYEAWRYSSILVIAGVFSSMSGFVGSFFAATKKTSIFAVSTIFAAIMNVVVSAMLIPGYGIYGASIATLVSFFIVWIMRLVFSKKYVTIKNNMIKDLLCYGLLLVQVWIEHLNNWVLWWQLCILFGVILLNFKEIKTIAILIFSLIKQKAIKEN